MKDKRKIFYLTIHLVLILILAGCNMPGAGGDATPTINVTQAYQTIEARLTEAATLTPAQSATPTPAPTTPAPTATQAALATTPAPAQVSPSPTSGVANTTCDQAAAGSPIDVTIPDNTAMQPGQAFTKTWRLQNTGTCTWTTAYSIAVFSGDAMGAPASVPMPKDVPPGQSVDISVDLTAPGSAGTYRGNWKLRNASNAWFGIGPGAASEFWVQIVVSGSVTGTPGTVTPTGTAASTPGTQATGKKVLSPGDQLNLDNGTLGGGAGDDIAFNFNPDGDMILAPLSSAVIGAYGQARPSLANCQAATLSAAPVTEAQFQNDLYLCYRTDLGLYGLLLLRGFKQEDNTLTVEFLTWAAP